MQHVRRTDNSRQDLTEAQEMLLELDTEQEKVV